METNLEGVLTIKVEDKLVALVYNDTKKHAQVFFTCSEMGAEDIKNLLETNNKQLCDTKSSFVK